jgi:hypothetical protein
MVLFLLKPMTFDPKRPGWVQGDAFENLRKQRFEGGSLLACG